MRVMRVACWALVCLLLSITGFGQTPDTATVRGQVFDQSRAAIAGVQVTITNRQTGLQRSVVTDGNGAFVSASLPIGGAYDIVAHKAGFAEARLENVTLRGGTAASFELQLNAGGTFTEINVTGVAGEVRTDQPQLGTWFGLPQVQDTPLLNRRITFLPLLNAANRPAISTGDLFTNQNLFTTNGAGRRQAWFEVDGGNGVDMWGRQTIFSTIPQDSVQEMTVLTNAFSAEYGGGVGSAINIVTKSGGNVYHGSALGVFRPADWGAKLLGATPTRATSGAQITSDSLKQTALDLSGPLFGDKTHFSLNGEYSWQDRVSPVTSPIAPGNFVGEYRGWLGFLKFDHQFNDKNNGFFRTNTDSFHDTNPAGAVGANTLPTVGRTFKRRTYSTEIGETAVITPSLLNNARAAFQLASPITEFDPFILGTQYQVVVQSLAATFTTGTSQSAKLLNHQYELSDTLSYIRGRHTLKFGADMVRAHSGGNSKEFGGPIYLGQFVFKPCNLSVLACETTYLTDINNVQSYTQSYGNANYTQDDTLWSMFAQDDIRVSSNFTVNAGIRYERQTYTDATKNFAPRAGFSYNMFGDGKVVLRGGYGIYYSQIPDNGAANYALSGPTGVFNYTAQAGQVGFPTSVAAAPLPAFPAGAQVPVRTLYIRPGRASYYNQFFPTSTLIGYQNALLNPYSQQWTLGVENEIAKNWVLSVDYVGSKTIKINRPLDVDPPTSNIRTAQGQPARSAQAANCTRPFWVWWYAQNGMTCSPTTPSNPQPPYALITSDVNNGYANYNALDINLNHRLSNHLLMLASYTWSHTLDNVDPDIPQQNPNDPRLTGHEEYANAIFDQRHRFVLSGVYSGPLKIDMGGVATFASGLPYNVTTGTTNSGDTGGTTDRPIVNGQVLPRNFGRGKAIYEVSPFVERAFRLGSERVSLKLRGEAFNVFNHPNFIGYNGVFGNAVTPPAAFGTPSVGIAAQLPARSFQISARLSF